jgi:RNA polymerase sigma factor (TIGR02999 family)
VLPCPLNELKKAGRSGNGVNDRALDHGDTWNADLPADARALADQLFPLFYEDLRRLAQRERRRVGAGATLQTTALVNEAYLKLRRGQGWRTDAHFLRASALAMRHALVNHAAAQRAAKRGAGVEVVPLQAGLDVAIEWDAPILALNAALGQLGKESPRLAQVVECRYFGGYTDVETAHALGVSERTVRNDWNLARAWLHRALANAVD